MERRSYHLRVFAEETKELSLCHCPIQVDPSIKKPFTGVKGSKLNDQEGIVI